MHVSESSVQNGVQKNLKLNGIFLENMNIKDEIVIKIIFNKRFKFYS